MVERIELRRPKVLVGTDPFVRLLQRFNLQSAGPPLGVTAACDQSRVFQHFEMLGDGRQAYLERRGELLHRRLAQGKARENRAARGVRQSPKNPVQTFGRVINHLVNYNRQWKGCQEIVKTVKVDYLSISARRAFARRA